MSKTRASDAVQNVPRHKRRCYLTHVALICDRPDIQPLLPQVIIANESTMPAALMPTLRAACPANVYLVRQKSAWNNADLCSRIVRWLRLALSSFLSVLQPVLLLDAVRVHTAPQVLRACIDCKIWLVLVPAKTTWLMQPLDTHAFMAFKTYLRQAYQEARIAAAMADLDIGRFLNCVYESIRLVLQGRRWLRAFCDNGFGAGQRELSLRILRQLQIDAGGRVEIPFTRPSLDQLRSCFPRRSVIPAALLWRPFDDTSAAVVPVSLSAAARPRRAFASEPLLQLGRTRAAHRAAQASHAAVVNEASLEAVSVAPLVARGMRLPRARVVVEELS